MSLDIKNMTEFDIQMEGMRALSKHLGIEGAVRFLRGQGVGGGGDYTRDRYEIIGEFEEDVIDEDGLTSHDIMMKIIERNKLEQSASGQSR